MFKRACFTVLFCLPFIIYGQTVNIDKGQLTLVPETSHFQVSQLAKMPCDPSTTSLTVISCSGETSNSTNGSAGDGASMTWTADGSQNLYFSQIINNVTMDTFRIVQGTTGDATYEPDADGSYTADLAVANGTTACLAAGTWTVRVWDVMDDDNDGNPDVDAFGEIIGCYAECTYTFFPVCPPPADNAFSGSIDLVSCAGDDGRIRLQGFNTSRFYCTDATGTDLDFNWSGPGGFAATTRDIAGIGPGQYDVTVTDFYGCSQVKSFMVGEQPKVALTCGATTPPSSIFQQNGTAMYTITDGAGPFNVQFSGPTTGSRNNVPPGTNTLFSLASGTYTLTVTDAATGCTDTCSLIVDPAPCLVNFTVDYTLGPDGIASVFVDPTGGSANFELTWVGPTTSTSPIGGIPNSGITLPGTDFTFGTYTFTLREQFRPDCATDLIVTFEPPNCEDIIITPLQLEDVACNGGMDGNITLDVSGGENPMVEWMGPGVNGSTSTTLSGLGAGQYIYVVMDDRGCSLTDTFNLTQPPVLRLVCVATDETANDNDDGKIGITLSGGTLPYLLSYTGTDAGGNDLPGQTDIPVADGDTLRDLQSGTYNLSVTDGNGCPVECSSLIEQPDCDVPLSCAATQPVIFGENGAVTLNATDGSAFAYDLLSQPGDVFVAGDLEAPGPRTINDLPPGQYTVNAFNFGGCTGTCSFEIIAAPCNLQATISATDPTCANSNDGNIELTITGETTGLTIDWADDAFDGMPTIAGLPPGTYAVTITDDGGCPPVELEATLTDPDAVAVDISQLTAIACAGDASATLRANTTGGEGALSYDWSVDTFPDNPVVTGVGAGTYFVTVTDGNGCTGQSLAYTVLEPTALSLACAAAAETEIGNADGKIGFTVAGGVEAYSFSLNGVAIARPPQDTITGLAPGLYTLEVTDANGCMTDCEATVAAGGCGAISVSINATQPDCDNPDFGSAEAIVSGGNGGISYAWSHGPTSRVVTDLAPGDYTVSITDAAGCPAENTVTIMAFTDAPTATISDFAPACADGCTTIEGTFTGVPPFTVTFVTGGTLPPFPLSLTVEGLALSQVLCPADFGLPNFEGATVEFTRITDANGCSRTLSELRGFSTAPPAIARFEGVRCARDTFFIEGRSFQEDEPAGTFVSAMPSAAGCDSTIEVNLTFLPEASGDFTPTICGTEPVVVGDQTFSPLRPTGVAVLSGASAAGCDSTVRVSVTYLAPAFSAQNPTICEGDTFRVGDEIFDAGRTAGTVTLSGEAANGCDSIVTVAVDIAPAGVSLAIEGSGLVCADNLVTVSATYNGARTASFALSTNPDSTFTLQNGTVDFTVTAAPGTLITILSADDGGVCPLVPSGEISVAATDLALSIENRTNPDLECGVDDMGILAATATGGQDPYSFSWSNGGDSPIQTALPFGSYALTVTDGNGCTSVAADTIQRREAFGLELNTSDPSCLDTFATIFIFDNIGGQPPFLFRVGDDDFRQVDSFPALLRVRPGVAVLEVEDASGCRTRRTFDFAAPELPSLTLTPNRATVPLGDSILVTVSGTFAVDSFSLLPGLPGVIRGNEVYLPANGTPNFQFAATDGLGCAATATFDLITDRSAPVYAPTAFSPNSDGVNDAFRLFPSQQVASIDGLTIHDRWGGQVYTLDARISASDQFWGWRGTLPDGDAAPAGVYFYTASATLLDGQVATLRGEVTLLR